MLKGFDSLDYRNQLVDERVPHNEIKKLYGAGMRALTEKLLTDAGD